MNQDDKDWGSKRMSKRYADKEVGQAKMTDCLLLSWDYPALIVLHFVTLRRPTCPLCLEFEAGCTFSVCLHQSLVEMGGTAPVSLLGSRPSV